MHSVSQSRQIKRFGLRFAQNSIHSWKKNFENVNLSPQNLKFVIICDLQSYFHLDKKMPPDVKQPTQDGKVIRE